MTLLKKIVIGIVLLIVALLLVGFVLPSSTHVERSITINATPAKVFAVVRDFQQFNQWSPWADIDPNTQYTFSGPNGEVGAKYEWRGNNSVGAGSQEITALTPDQDVQLHLIFEGQGDAKVAYRLTENNGTTMTWTFDTEHGVNPLNRWFGLMFDSMIGADYEKGLSKLKIYVEGLPDQMEVAPVAEEYPGPQAEESVVVGDDETAGEPPTDDEPPVEQDDEQ